MREVDTGALLRVAPFLGIGNPHTAVTQVVFDDDNLQQVLDVSRLVTKRRSYYFEYTLSANPGAGATDRDAASMAVIEASDAGQRALQAIEVDSFRDLDLYLCRIGASTPDPTNLGEVGAGVHHADGTLYQLNAVVLYRATGPALQNGPLVAGDQEWLEPENTSSDPINDRLWSMPLYIETRPNLDAEIVVMTTAGGGGGATGACHFGFVALPAGVPFGLAV